MSEHKFEHVVQFKVCSDFSFEKTNEIVRNYLFTGNSEPLPVGIGEIKIKIEREQKPIEKPRLRLKLK